MIHENDPTRPGLRWSSLSKILVSPLEYRHQIPRGSKAMALGTLIHDLTFFGDEKVVVWEGGDRRGKAWQEFAALHEGKEIYKPHEIAHARECADVAKEKIADLLDGYFVHTPVIEKDLAWKRDGVQCGGRPDLYAILDTDGDADRRCILVDLKTTRSIEQRALEATVARYNYHAQLAWYSSGLATSGIFVDEVFIVWVKTDGVPDGVVTTLDHFALQAGHALADEAFELFKACVAANSWPGQYPPGKVVEISLPAWVDSGADDDVVEIESADDE